MKLIRKLRRDLNNWAGTIPNWVGYCIAILLVGLPIAIGATVLAAILFMLLWNYLLIWLFPIIPPIDVWRSITLVLIFTLLEIRNAQK